MVFQQDMSNLFLLELLEQVDAKLLLIGLTTELIRMAIQKHIFFEGKARFVNNIITSRMALNDEGTSIYATERGIETQSSISSNGNLICTGTKNRAVETEDYGIVLMNTLETTGAYFSDIGSGTIMDGACYIYIDSKFEEVIDNNSEYHILITQTSEGRIDYTKKKMDILLYMEQMEQHLTG